VGRGPQQVHDALLVGDAAHKEDIGDFRVDPVPGQDFKVVGGFLLLYVDPVKDDPHLFLRHAVQFLDVILHGPGHGNDAVGVFIGGSLHPGADPVAPGAQLLFFPGAVGFQGMRRQDQGFPEKLFEETACQVRIPGVAVNNVHLLETAGHEDVPEDGRQEPHISRLLKGEGEVHLHALHRGIALGFLLLPEAQDLEKVAPAVHGGQLSREEMDVHPGAPINVRRIFVG
jgi:hypothetical protein